jgi:hypothetical protein
MVLVPLTLGTGQAAVPERFPNMGIARSADVVGPGTVAVHGHLECDRNQQIRIDLTLRQRRTGASLSGSWSGTCSPAGTAWTAVLSGGQVAPGNAVACATASGEISWPNGSKVSHQWCRGVQLSG